jgi:hypothetical protein
MLCFGGFSTPDECSASAASVPRMNALLRRLQYHQTSQSGYAMVRLVWNLPANEKKKFVMARVTGNLPSDDE